MKRNLTLLLIAMMTVAMAYAVPAKRTLHTFAQSDGTTILVTMMGDEFHHCYVTTDGLTVEQTENGDFYYLTANGRSTMLAHNPEARDAGEEAYLSLARPSMGLDKVKSKRVIRREDERQVPCTGSPKIPIILVNYTDITFKSSDPLSVFKNQFNEMDYSCLAYFTDQSRGKFTPQFDILGPVTMANNRKYYGGNDSYGFDKQLGTMVYEACQGVSGVDFSDYDNDGDGNVDVVIVLYAGVGEAQAYSTVPESVWPCQWNLDECYEMGYSTSASFKLNGVTINKFAVFNELDGAYDSGTTIDGIGTFCHEFSHCLGLPDFYYTGSGNVNIYGMDAWSLMDYGCYNNDGKTPCGYTSYERNFMGWLDLIDPVENTQYTLEPLNTDKGEAVKVVNDQNSNEYYLLENRQQTGWDAYLDAAGLMILHVDYDATAWEENSPNNTSSHQRMTLIPADNKLTSSTNSGDLWPYNGLDSLTNNSTPAAKVFTGTYMNKPITEITRTGSNISFWYMKTVEPAIEAPVMLATDSSAVTSTSFKADWTSVENAASYTLYVNFVDTTTKPVALLLDEDCTEGSTTWTTSESGTYSEDGYFRLGTSKATGSITSPAVDLSTSDGEVSVVVVAKSYGNDTDVEMKVSVLDASDNELDSETVTISGSDAQYIVALKGNADDSNYIRIENTTKKKRVMLKTIKVYTGDYNTLSSAPLRAVTETGDTLTRTIEGITDTTYTVTDLLPYGIFDYKVKAITADNIESAWSNVVRIALFDQTKTGLVGDVNADGEVNIADVNALISIILGNATEDDYAGECDVNGDEEINIADVNAVIAIILGQEE